MEKCGNADKYRGIYPPRCNNGQGCDVCNKKYEESKREVTETSRLIREHQFLLYENTLRIIALTWPTGDSCAALAEEVLKGKTKLLEEHVKSLKESNNT